VAEPQKVGMSPESLEAFKMKPQVIKKHPSPFGKGCPENPGFRLSYYLRRLRLAKPARPSSTSAPGAGTPDPSRLYA